MLFLQGHFSHLRFFFLLGIDAGYSDKREPFQRIVLSQLSEQLLMTEAAESSETTVYNYLRDITHQITAKFIATATVNTHSKLFF